MALCQGLVAVPVWLAGRELGLGRWAAVVAAAIAAGGSFAIYGITTLNQAVGLLCATTMLWAMVRALRRPGLASDLLVLAALAATALARLGWAPLVVALVPGALAAAWFERPVGEGLGGWVRALPARLVRRHPVLVPLSSWGSSSRRVGSVDAARRRALRRCAPGARPRADHAVGQRAPPLQPSGASESRWCRSSSPFRRSCAISPGRPMRPAAGFAWLVLGLLVVFSYILLHVGAEDRYLAVLGPAVRACRRRSPSFVGRRRYGRCWSADCSRLVSSRRPMRWPRARAVRLLPRPHLALLRAHRRSATSWSVPAVLRLHVPRSRCSSPLRRRRRRRGGRATAAGRVDRSPRPPRRSSWPGCWRSRSLPRSIRRGSSSRPSASPDVPTEDRHVHRSCRARWPRRAAGGRRCHRSRSGRAALRSCASTTATLGAGMAVMRGPRPPRRRHPPPSTGSRGLADRRHRVDRTGARHPAREAGIQRRWVLRQTCYPGSHAPLPVRPARAAAAPVERAMARRGDSVQGYPQRGDPLRLRVFPPTGSSHLRARWRRGPLHSPTVPAATGSTARARSLRGVVQPGAADAIRRPRARRAAHDARPARRRRAAAGRDAGWGRRLDLRRSRWLSAGGLLTPARSLPATRRPPRPPPRAGSARTARPRAPRSAPPRAAGPPRSGAPAGRGRQAAARSRRRAPSGSNWGERHGIVATQRRPHARSVELHARQRRRPSSPGSRASSS